MSENQVATTKEAKIMEFVPFGAKDAIKLSVSIVKTLIAQPTKSGHYPTDNDCMKFLMMCQAKRLNPFEQDCWLLGYDTQEGPKFSQITAHQAFLKRAELNKEYDGMESGVVVQRGNEIMDVEGDFTLETDKLVGGWARVHFKTRSRPMFKRIKLTTYTTGKSQWLKNPAGMIVKCAEADALRSSFPTMLGGLYVGEEMGSATTTERAVSKPIFNSPTTELPRNSEVGKDAPTEAVVVDEITDDNTEKVRLNCLKSDIGESTLINYMASIGLADAGATIEQTNYKYPKAMAEVVKRWDDIEADIKKEAV